MNKNKNNYRKCAFCPHHNNQMKCCCRKQFKTIETTKKSKLKPTKILNQSSIQYLDQNLNMLNLPLNKSNLLYNKLDLPSLILQNQKLKHQNKSLKNDLFSMSNYINQQKIPCKQYQNISTLTTLKTQTEQSLSDRLYLSNRNLQQAVLRIDVLSIQNKQLNERNCKLKSQLQNLNLQNTQLNQDARNLRKQMKRVQQKINQASEKNTSKQQIQIYKQKCQNLKLQNSKLLQQIQKLKQMLKNKSPQNRENMSPQWVAQTSNKLSFIEQKIQHAENKLKNSQFEHERQSVQTNMNKQLKLNSFNQSNNYKNAFLSYQSANNLFYFQIINDLKKDLALTINTIHSKTRKFNSIFDNLGNIDNTTLSSLICNLIQGIIEASLNQNMMLEKQLNRKITVLQKKMQNLFSKLQNLVLSIKNKQLRNKSTSRSRILMSSKSGHQNKSPCIKKREKQNMSPLINNLDKSN